MLFTFKIKTFRAYLLFWKGTLMNNMLATFQFGKAAVRNGKVVKITGWARKKPKTLRTYFSESKQFKKRSNMWNPRKFI